MFDRKKQLLRWKDIRRKGKWRFFLVYGGLLMPLYLIFNLIINPLFGTEEHLSAEVINAIIFTVVYIVVMWLVMEWRFKRPRR